MPQQRTSMPNTHSAPAGSPNAQYFSELPTPSRYRNDVTGLFNQKYLRLAVDCLIKEQQSIDTPSTLVLLQLENFYEIKSWVGESEANLLLGDIAGHVQASLPANALLCHLKHREFALLLSNESSLKAIMVADKIRQNLPRRVSPFIPPQLELRCAVGIAAINNRTPDADVVQAQARHDLRLSHYRAQSKQNNKSYLQSYTPVQADAVLKSIRRALDQQQLSLRFQGLLNFRSNGPQLVELRLRLQDKGKVLSAAMFLETAIQNALGEQLDRWVLAQACEILKKSDSQLGLIINLSQNSLVSPDFFGWLQRLLDNSGSNPAQLFLQLSEIDVLVAQHHMDYFCYKLKQLGLNLSINNFGCTDKPFQILSLLQAQMVKLDAALLDKLQFDSNKQETLTADISRLHQRKLKVCAGMVEKIALLPLLWKVNLDYVQGNCLQPLSESLDLKFVEEVEMKMDC